MQITKIQSYKEINDFLHIYTRVYKILHLSMYKEKRKNIKNSHFFVRFHYKQNSDLFRLCPPPPPSTLCAPQLQSRCHYIVNHHSENMARASGACK